MSSSPARSGIDAARRAGLAGLTLSALFVLVGPVVGRLLPSDLAVAAYPVQVMLGIVALVALVRVVAAGREPQPEPPDLVDDSDRRVLPATRRAAGLRYGLLRYALLDIVTIVAATILVLPLAGDLLANTEDLSRREQFEISLPLTLVAALFQAFIAVVPQRMALRRDPRVMIAVVHSVRVARTNFGALFALTLLPLVPLVSVSAMYAYRQPVAAEIALLLVAVPVQLLSTAWLNETYLRGPQLELPPELERPAD